MADQTGYEPGEQPREIGYVKLNTNENPYPPSPRVFEALKRAVNDQLRLYPDPLFSDLRGKISEVYGVDREGVILGNGGDEILSMVTRTFAEPGDELAFVYPSYVLYEILGRLNGLKSKVLDLEDDFSLPEGIFEVRAKILFLSSPNSPTGTLFQKTDVSRVCDEFPGLVVLDEAYVDFAPVNCLDLVGTHDNILVLRSFSKSFSLAGMRTGFAVGRPEVVRELMKVKDSYNLNRLSQVAAVSALDDLQHMRTNVEKIKTTRERLVAELSELGFTVYPSAANFVLAQPGNSARGIHEALKERKILVRYFDQRGLEDCLRISVGTDEEVEILLEHLRQGV